MKKADFFLILSVIAISLVMIAPKFLSSGAESVKISVDGKVWGIYSLDEGRTVELEHNTVRIEGGKVFMQSADCPDRSCVKQGKISRPGESIICLPNRVVVEIEGEPDDGIDAYTE